MSMIVPADVETHIGRSFTTEQAAQCAQLIPSVEDWITRHCGQVFSDGPVNVSEVVFSYGTLVWLSSKPVVSVESALGGYKASDTTVELACRIVDAEKGIVSVTGAFAYDYVSVSYTIGLLGIPPVVKEAAIVLCAHWMQPTLMPDALSTQSYSVGGELTVTPKTMDVPKQVYQLLEDFTPGVYMA